MSIIISIALPRVRALIPFNSTPGRPQPPYLLFKRVRFLIEPLLFGSGRLRTAQLFKSFADREFGCWSHARSIAAASGLRNIGHSGSPAPPLGLARALSA